MTATYAPLEDRLDFVRQSPRDRGELKMIVIRPRKDERTVLQSCRLSLARGAEGDNWADGCWMSLPDGSPHPDVQLTLMSTRVLEAIEPSSDRWPLAGDNLCVDFNLGTENLQPGDRLSIGEEVILEITGVPHLGCGKFQKRFGKEALALVNSDMGKQLRLRGIYARVAKDGVVRVGDTIANERPRG